MHVNFFFGNGEVILIFEPKIPDSIFETFEEPIRSEIFGVQRLISHAESLAHAQKVTNDPRQGRELGSRVHENARLLTYANQLIMQAVDERRAITPAAEWLIDNFHIVRSQLKDVRDHLPPAYYKRLPKIAEGPLAGYPRVYGIAWAFVAHTDSKLDTDLLRTFLDSYQRIQPLTMGELWAIPITLRLVLIENLRRLAIRIVGSQRGRADADRISDAVLKVGSVAPRESAEVILELQNQKLGRAFAVQLLQRLRFQEDRVGPVLQVVESQLAQQGDLLEDWVSSEFVAQSTANITVRNIITSARLMSAIEWPDFFEQCSLVDHTLRAGSDFGQMDFITRDRYRHAIEELASSSPLTEIEISQELVTLCAREKLSSGPGYFLIGDGREILEDVIDYHVSPRTRLLRAYKRHGTLLHVGSILLLTFAFAALALSPYTDIGDEDSAGLSWILFLVLTGLALFPASEIAVALINRLTVAILGPRYLPRLDLESGLKTDMRTMVVVPTMLNSPTQVRGQLEQLEIHYLANQDDNLFLGLLSDFSDGAAEFAPQDELLIELAYSELARLNARYPVAAGSSPRFSVYHRRRQWNAGEVKWMGWERKRGKLQEFNQLLLGASNTSYANYGGIIPQPPKDIRYVVTLDADTKLPRGTVHKLVGTMAHPLNQPRFDEETKIVVSGYGILQPRVTPSLPSFDESTIFRRLTTARSGIDPYASAVSDVYQDLFDEGTFTGKGIYDLRAFEKALHGRFPDNAVLSHDLLEGSFARCGYLSDVDFFEDFPSHAGVADLRNHRWMRGDWQLLPWIFGRRGKDLSIINRWKMIDNLRRSLVAPAGFALAIVALLTMGLAAGPMLGLVLAYFLVSPLITIWADLWPRRQRRHLGYLGHVQGCLPEWRDSFQRSFMLFALWPAHAWVSIDAIARALYRMTISHRHLLEWTAAAQAKAAASLELKFFWRAQRRPIAITALSFLAIAWGAPTVAPLLVPMFALWLAGPFTARMLSAPPDLRDPNPLTNEDSVLFRTSARRIWHFFATFVTEADHHLPPDNFQETPLPVIAHRSSPTNFGLYLLAAISARDMGWIGTTDTLQRLKLTLDSLLQLERYEGHFLNWYDTASARPLEPRYISSVDNGNLTGHLYAVAQTAEEILNSPVLKSFASPGRLDTLAILRNAFGPSPIDPAIKAQLDQLETDLAGGSHAALPLMPRLRSLRKLVDQLADDLRDHPNALVKEWVRTLRHEIHSTTEDELGLHAWRDEALQAWPGNLHTEFLRSPALIDLPNFATGLQAELFQRRDQIRAAGRQPPAHLEDLAESLDQTIKIATHQVAHLKSIQASARRLIHDMDFRLLFDQKRKLFSIGFRVDDQKLDPSYYDLLASEARLTSFIAIAKGDVPVSHWFHLGRSLVPAGPGNALVSWSGSMFEYLMPCVVMQSPAESLLEVSCRNAILRQIEYAKQKNVPWGMSESAYNKRDIELTYQYSNFGVPDLALKRGLGVDTVVAPYATLLAALFEPRLAAVNLRALRADGGEGLFGFYEAIDYTATRLPAEKKHAVIKTYMAHHQGMALVSLANVFCDSAMQKRFHADPQVQATELLLQERTPQNIGTLPPPETKFQVEAVHEPVEHVSRKYFSVNRPVPTTQVLSNGNYMVMLTSAGAGFSRVRDLAVTRWREDVTRDHYGSFIYLKDLQTKNVWSAGHQPVCTEADHYEVEFFEDRARYLRRDHGIQTELEVFVSTEENAEVRRLRVTNQSTTARELEVTSYAEVVLNLQNADIAHPAFSNLFVETEFLTAHQTLLATRRPRKNADKRLWLMHQMRGDAVFSTKVEFETDRGLFLGRGRSVRQPRAIFQDVGLSGTVGPVLDPIVSLRRRVKLAAGESAEIVLTTGLTESREAIELMVEKFADSATCVRARDLAWTQAQVRLHYLGIEPDEAHLFQRLNSRLVYSDPTLRAPADVLRRNQRDLPALWAHGISGDHPLILVRIDALEDRNLVRQLLKLQTYFATKAFVLDLVILNEKANSYAQELQIALEQMAQSAFTRSALPLNHGKVFVLRNDLLPESDRLLIASEARVILSTRMGSLSDQAQRTARVPKLAPKRRRLIEFENPPLTPPVMEFFNGVGGYSDNGRTYSILLKPGVSTPAPWINVIANPSFGFQVSESGAGYTWAMNSRENQLTPWSNDPVVDPCGEAIFISDRDSGMLWSPTASPIRKADADYYAHHSAGLSHFETNAFGLRSELRVFVDPERPVKISRVLLHNPSTETRKLSVTSYAEWVLGFSRATMAPTTLTEFDAESKAIFAWNPRNSEQGTRIAFCACLTGTTSYTADRSEFIGRNSSLATPYALLSNDPLSGKSGPALDPCAAVQTEVTLPPGATTEIVFVIGQTANREEARQLLGELRASPIADREAAVHRQWDQLLGHIQVETPDRSFDIVMNRWYLYQTIVCRLWARAAFYQAGGAFGFRDQLQDVMAVVYTAPHLVREQIVRAAARQFIEGDVQHWWHPPTGRGVRTHFSDDLVWLPYVTARYIEVTGDTHILDETVHFLEGPPLPRAQEDSYDTPATSSQTASIFEHCARALDISLKTGAHGLPLMGSGDWNDGMNHVGMDGLGESVWMGWFLTINLRQFAKHAESRGEHQRAQNWAQHAHQLVAAIEDKAWDGDWYRRAFYGDGTPLGSKTSDECQIDSLAQSWALISGAGDPARARTAMQAVDQHLVKANDQMILLFTPPFDKTPRDPGYIKGYLPGVRENGGQYTHAASWVVIAQVLLKNGDEAHRLFSALNPIHHASDLPKLQRYKIEPYVLAGDVYSQKPHTGRGGWSWYTGASGWMYRAGLESILGLRQTPNVITFEPCLPKNWIRASVMIKVGDEMRRFEVGHPQSSEPPE